jgi:hypothetical protein
MTLLLTPLAQAQVKLTLSAREVVVFAGETEVLILTITNEQDVADTFSISVWPPFLRTCRDRACITTSLEQQYVELEGGGSADVWLRFDIALDAEEFTSAFEIGVTSVNDPTVKDLEEFLLTTKRRVPYYIQDLKLNKYTFLPNESVMIEVQLRNLAATPSPELTLQTNLKKDDKLIGRFDDVLVVDGGTTLTITHTYTFDVYAEPGDYFIETVLKEAGVPIHIQSVRLSVKEMWKLPTEYTEKTTHMAILWTTTVIKVRNDGNVATPSFYVSESIPGFMSFLFDPEIEPDKKEVVNGRAVYKWLVPSLRPGEEVTVVYSFNLWIVWLVGAVIIGATVVGYQYLYTLRLTKIPRYRGPITYEREIPIILDVINRTPRELTNVVIEDFVPPIARVVKAFDTVPPKLKETRRGTEIRWEVGTLKPGEERIMTYKIKPVVEIIGTLRLPKAYIRYTDRKKRKRVIASKSIAIKPE